MRHRLVISTIVIVLVVLTALIWPVLLLVHRSAENELRARLDEQVVLIGAALDDDLRAGLTPDLATVQDLLSQEDGIRILDQDGDVITAVNTDIPSPVRATWPGPNGIRIELITSAESLNERFREQAVILVALSVGALAAAAALAAVQARQLARPLENLAHNAARLGAGDFSTTVPPASGITEIDNIAGALRASATRVDRMLAAERSFTADATHQLRTGLTGIALRLEMLERHQEPAVREEAGAALAQTHQLSSTLDELLEVVRHGSSGQRAAFDLVELVDAHASDWSQRFASRRRALRVVTTEPRRVVGTTGLAGQIIDILVDNALRHGGGDVVIAVEGERVTVSDEGAGMSDQRASSLFTASVDESAPHGRGLALARRMAEADGGRVELVSARPAVVRYTLVPA